MSYVISQERLENSLTYARSKRMEAQSWPDGPGRQFAIGFNSGRIELLLELILELQHKEPSQ